MVEFLTGAQGVSPGYDPLGVRGRRGASARDRAARLVQSLSRARRGTKGPLRESCDAERIPSGCDVTAKQLWIDPGEPAARAYVIDVILDLVRRYDVDGVHIDDYFYPYPLQPGDVVSPMKQAGRAMERRAG